MQLKIEDCTKCEEEMPIVNRKYKLCQRCNRERLHPTEGSLEESKKKRQAKLFQSLKRTPIKRGKRPKQTSLKQREANVRIADTYEQMAKTREHICTGCGTTKRLSHSHIIPRSRRKDLEADIKNLTYHCLTMGEQDGCHDIWEHGSLDEQSQLNDFDKNLEYIKSVDEQYYNLITS